jgi:hypothetical protein
MSAIDRLKHYSTLWARAMLGGKLFADRVYRYMAGAGPPSYRADHRSTPTGQRQCREQYRSTGSKLNV